MTHFAEVINGIVTRVIVAEQEFIDNLNNSNQWIQTSYNTHHGINDREGGIPLRKNYAGIGYIYDNIKDVFIPIKPFNSWILDDSIGDWVAPIPHPNDNKMYSWNEDGQTWDLISQTYK